MNRIHVCLRRNGLEVNNVSVGPAATNLRAGFSVHPSTGRQKEKLPCAHEYRVLIEYTTL